MPIVVKSLPDQAGIRSLRKFFRGIAPALHRLIRSFRHTGSLTKRQILVRSVAGLLAIAFVAGGDILLRSYKYYSRVIDARLASGYLTSRPGLYAAPRSIQIGQKISRSGLINALQRAGYNESQAGCGNLAWNGCFSATDSAIEIRPARKSKGRPGIVRAGFDRDQISELTGDDIRLDSFTLEPEVLSNDLSSKTGKRETVRYSEIPPVLVQAILSIEDHRFFNHSGLDLLGIGRALLRNAGDERVGQGGSTITQQLVKNTYLTPERTLRRKYAEAMLAFALERRLSKQDIFALYCNEIYLGQRGAVAARGVREATHIYFGKDLKDLSLNEAATLAGMIQGPVRYSPVRHAEAAQARRNMVLEAMMRDGWIDTAQYAEVLGKPVVVSAASTSYDSLAPYFVDYVIRTSESRDASPSTQRVYTTIDLDLQQLAEAALKKQLARLEGVYKHRDAKPQAALVALDPRTGNVVAMVGGRDYARSQLNRAVDARRQPGSTFKPFVYAAALEDGMSPVQQFADAPREFVYDHNKVYRPANFGGGYSMRDVTMREGLVKSLNVVTVDVAMQTGLARIANLAAKFGLPRPERYPSLALGTEEVTPLQLAAAYATFVNGGRRVQPKVIAGVGEPPTGPSLQNEQGNEPRSEISSETDQVISPTTAYMVTNMLTAVVDHGTGRAARGSVKGTAIAGKTGTSRDGWFVGYTQNLVCVVWIGFDDNQQLGLTGATAALPAWMDFMSAAIELRPQLGGRNFECPDGINFVEIDSDSGQRSTLTCPHRELIAVTDRLMPNLECLKHGNLPELKDLVDDNVRKAEDETVLAQHRSAPLRLDRLSSAEVAATSVGVDGRGRRTLVNEMR